MRILMDNGQVHPDVIAKLWHVYSKWFSLFAFSSLSPVSQVQTVHCRADSDEARGGERETDQRLGTCRSFSWRNWHTSIIPSLTLLAVDRHDAGRPEWRLIRTAHSSACLF